MNIITIRNKELHRIFILLGVLLSLVVFLFSQTVSSWFYLGFVPIGIIMSISSGVQIDLEKKKYRSYKHLCFWTRGEWKQLSDKTNIVALVKHGTKSTTGTMMAHTMKTKGGFSELYFMDENHIRRFFIDSSENHTAIEKLAMTLSDSLGLEIKPYRPRK